MLEHTQHSTSISMQVKLHKHKLATHACLRASSSARQTTPAQAIPESRPRLSSCARPLRLAKPDPPASSLALTTHARHAGPPRAAAGTMPCRPLPSPHPAAAFPPHACSLSAARTAVPNRTRTAPATSAQHRLRKSPPARSVASPCHPHRQLRRHLSNTALHDDAWELPGLVASKYSAAVGRTYPAASPSPAYKMQRRALFPAAPPSPHRHRGSPLC